MKKPIVRRLVFYGVLILLLGCTYPALEIGADFCNIILPWHRHEAIEATCKWGGLAPFPSIASQMSIRTSGGMFTRTFDVTFRAPTEIIRAWVRESKRLRDSKPSSVGPTRDRFEVGPGEDGAIGGWVEIDWGTGDVKIHMAWS